MYTDSDHNSERDLVSRISFVGFMNKNLVTWKSKKLSSTISMSSCESEFYASESGGAEAMYLRRIAYELDKGVMPQDESEMEECTLLMDNQAAIRVLQQDGFNNRTKHIAVRYLWVKQEVMNRRLKPRYVSTHQNLADALTKPLRRSHLFRLLDLMGMKAQSTDTGASNGGECESSSTDRLIALLSAGRICSSSEDFRGVNCGAQYFAALH
jgi:hypothetical protein